MADSDDGSGRDAALLCVLNDIHDLMKKYEPYVAAQMEEWEDWNRRSGSDADGSSSHSNSEHSGDVGKANSIERKDCASAEEKDVDSKPSQDEEYEVAPVIEIVQAPLPREGLFYQVPDIEFAGIKDKEWFKSREQYSRGLPADLTVPIGLPESPISEWGYFKPLWKSNFYGTKSLMYCYTGKGRPNFSGPWDKPGIGHNLDTDDLGDCVLHIPYSSLPPIDLDELLKRGQYRLPFNDNEQVPPYHLLKGLRTLPPDYRLNIDFQNHMLRQLDAATDVGKYVLDIQKKHESIYERGGIYEVEDIDTSGSSHTYSIQSSMSATQVEEWFLNIPSHQFRTTPQGFPLEYRTDDKWKSMPFNRIVTVRGLDHTYKETPWTSVDCDPDNISNGHLLDLHNECRLRADESLSGYPPAIFHICWMEIQETGQRVMSAAEMQFFGDVSPLTKKNWTLLVLGPKSRNQSPKRAKSPKLDQKLKNPGKQSLLMNMCTLINHFMEQAASSWMAVGQKMEELILFEIDDLNDILHDDGIFLQTQKLFWIIKEVDGILPMIRDAVQQWNWFYNTNGLSDLGGNEQPYTSLHGDISQPINETNECEERLENAEKLFKEIRERAKSLRDGLIGIASVKEAKESRILSENVRLLTYITIFYLPIALCTSMWAINDMFGTGVNGFGIITASISVGTYVVAFILLQLTSPPNKIGGVMRSLHSIWPKKLGSTSQFNNPQGIMLIGAKESEEKIGKRSGISQQVEGQALRKRTLGVISRLYKGGKGEQHGDGLGSLLKLAEKIDDELLLEEVLVYKRAAKPAATAKAPAALPTTDLAPSLEISGLPEPEEPEPELVEPEPDPEPEPPLGTTGHWHISSPEEEEPVLSEPLEELIEPAELSGVVEPAEGVGHEEPDGQTVSVEPVG
ncbi:hypothetical protein EG329_005659 [Mollisiaceae sp. DMI_Dod_QoI]|nr:hypothetical protein EG329_005659 [Helotiales sp. DMI_Dod_QoI]